MKKIVAIIMLLVFLFSATDFRELFKTGMLVRHFYATKQIDPTVSIFKFLVWHYVTDDLNDTDNDQDKQLPFKSAYGGSGNNTQIIYSHAIVTTQIQLFIKNECCYLIFPESNTSPKISFFVWHPPQVS